MWLECTGGIGGCFRRNGHFRAFIVFLGFVAIAEIVCETTTRHVARGEPLVCVLLACSFYCVLLLVCRIWVRWRALGGLFWLI